MNKNKSDKREGWITKSKAKKLVIKREDNMVHTFYNLPLGLLGGDHSYESIMKDIDNSQECNVTGKTAQTMNHGLAIIPKGKIKQSDILFVETINIKENSK